MKRDLEIPYARLEDLEQLHQFVDSFAEQTGLNESIVFALRLAIEEVYVNLIQHGYKGEPNYIAVSLEADARRVSAVIHDYAPPFPPEHAPHPNLGQDWASRPVGGLGWHFIREMMDEIRYQSDPKNGNNLMLAKWLK